MNSSAHTNGTQIPRRKVHSNPNAGTESSKEVDRLHRDRWDLVCQSFDFGQCTWSTSDQDSRPTTLEILLPTDRLALSYFWSSLCIRLTFYRVGQPGTREIF
eukprot:TRINITY_DN65608_c0_g1_i1.p1 TRINITY_DN65608_c0_g1~~TRINITY_DN65608_c0_g1_i1.p1  ORF type:complete len:102 (-),score=0.27 TRINITY_DN65608_c0_g1_i1:197-502(-)